MPKNFRSLRKFFREKALGFGFLPPRRQAAKFGTLGFFSFASLRLCGRSFSLVAGSACSSLQGLPDSQRRHRCLGDLYTEGRNGVIDRAKHRRRRRMNSAFANALDAERRNRRRRAHLMLL